MSCSTTVCVYDKYKDKIYMFGKWGFVGSRVTKMREFSIDSSKSEFKEIKDIVIASEISTHDQVLLTMDGKHIIFFHAKDIHIIEILDGDGYKLWRCTVKLPYESRNVSCVITGDNIEWLVHGFTREMNAKHLFQVNQDVVNLIIMFADSKSELLHVIRKGSSGLMKSDHFMIDIACLLRNTLTVPPWV